MKIFIEENTFFFSLYYHLYRKHRGIKPNWFSDKTELYFDGYPRSGNTFLSHLIRNTFINAKSVHHLHKIAPIKIALKKSLPVYILIRQPEDAITSNYLKQYALNKKQVPNKVNIELLTELTEQYVRYYSYVFENLNNLYLIPFSFLVEQPLEVIKHISISLSRDYQENIVKEAKDSFVGATDKLSSSKPNPYKQKKKKELSGHLLNIKNYSDAEKIFNKVIATN